MAAPAGDGDNGGDHTRSPAVFLNGVHPKRTDGADIRAGMTIDQIAALKIGQETPLPSLELATEDYSGLVGSCDVGFSCAYMNTISWRTPTTPLPMEINPRVVFDRLFGDGANAAERLERIEQQRSILDAAMAQVRRLEGGLGPERPQSRRRISRHHPRNRAPHPARREAERQLQPGRAHFPRRHPRRSSGAYQADVRSDGARFPGRHHARLDLHDGARGQLPHFPDARHLGRLPPGVASSEQSRRGSRT